MTALTALHSAESRLVYRLATLTTQVRAAMERRRVYRTTLNELKALSNRELADLGINRSMITRIAIDAANGDN